MRLSKKGKIRIAVLAFLACVGLLYFLIYVAPGISDIFVETYTAEYGTLDVDFNCDGVFVRTERVYTADYPGAVDRVAQAGELKTISSNIVNVGGTAYYSQERGVVGYQYDNMETVFTPETMLTVGQSALHPAKDEEGKSVYELRDCATEAAAGDPVFKIYDNQTWYILTFVDRDTAVAIRDAGTVSVELPDQNKTKLKFRVHYVDEITEETQDTTDAQDSADESSKTESGDNSGSGDKTEAQEPEGPAETVKYIAEKAYEPPKTIDLSSIGNTGGKVRDISSAALEAKNTADQEAAGETETETESGEAPETGETGDTQDTEELYRVILSCNRYYSELGSIRYGTVRIITAQKTGIILETASIVEVDGQKGVYVVNKYGDYVFTPIRIISVLGDKTVVESHTFYDSETDTTYYTVNNYDSIKKRGGVKDVDQG
ncbi:MAG: hypothetical protein IJT40_02470 [Firmicutes bacterium]|nr:hypothetical protein [Bacillota bacterium]